MKAFWFAIILTILYAAVAIAVASQDFNCGGGLDLNFCGFNTTIMTLPSQLTVGRIFANAGMRIEYMRRTPNASELEQLAVHITVSAIFVFLVGYGIGRLGSYFMSLVNRSHTFLK